MCAPGLHAVLSVGAFLKTDILQGSMATPFSRYEICNEGFVANFLLSVSVKEL